MAQNNFVSTLVLGDDGLPSNFVINDEKRVCKIEDRGESRLPPNARPPTAPGTPQHNQVINLVDVAGQLFDASEQFAPENNTEFVPRAKFEKIISPEVVLQIVRALGCYKDLPQEQQQAIARDIYYGKPYEKPSRKLLAALIATGDKSEPKDKFSAVIQDGVNDHCLPLFKLPSQQGVNQSLLCEGHGRAHQSLEKVVSEAWPSFPNEFLRLCRTLMPPFIVWEDGGKHCHYIMRGGGALPARPDDPPVICANGGFGEVHKVQIDQGDRNFSLHDNGQNYFALKKLHRKGDLETRSKEFDLEVRSLIFAESRVNHVAGLDQETKEHLIPLLATFEIYHSSEPTYYFLFPWADGNLEDLWKTEDGNRCPRDINQLGFMVHQFYYMAKTLECVHNDRLLIAPNTGSDGHRYGRHGDIKPTNYLYFRNNSDRNRDDNYNIRWQGLRIVLADFGLGSLHRKQTKSNQKATDLGHTATYAAPECDDDNSELVSQKSDIFSLGCVFLLHIVWLLEGADLSPTTEASEEYKEEQTVLHCFSKARLHEKDLHPDLDKFKTDRFWKYTKAKGFVIKDSVKDKIEGLKNRDDCMEVVGEMLTVIENGMLQVNKGKRYDAKELVHRLQKIYFNWKHEGNELGDYCTRSWKEKKRGLTV
ncbi:Protein kinase-like domain containing protein [Rhypophila decipiens]